MGYSTNSDSDWPNTTRGGGISESSSTALDRPAAYRGASEKNNASINLGFRVALYL